MIDGQFMKYKHIHFVGIKGVGMAPLAIIAKEAGFEVSGCDISEEFITDESLKKAGITPLIGFGNEHVRGVDLVITTGAHGGFDNEEVKAAKTAGVQVLTQGEAVGVFMKGEIFGRSDLMGISVAGTHGKTTTTAMLATILAKNNMDPSFVIGTGNVPSLGSCGHYGKGKYFVAEADEYVTEPTYDKTIKFMWQKPKMAIFTNIEFDHPDVYSSADDLRSALLAFSKHVEKDGLLIVNGDDSQIERLLADYKGKVIKFGYSGKNDFRLKKVSISFEQTFFWLDAYGTDLGEFCLKVPGEHNGLNALPCIIASLEIGLDILSIKKAISKFSGTKRRAEYIGKLEGGTLLFDDYAHHPTEIQKTLKAFAQTYPKHNIVCIFQPHTYSRTKALFNEFSRSFYDCDELILISIYPSQREKEDIGVSSESLATAIRRFQRSVSFLPSAKDVVKYIEEKGYQDNTIIITMGAGDVYKLWRSLL